MRKPILLVVVIAVLLALGVAAWLMWEPTPTRAPETAAIEHNDPPPEPAEDVPLEESPEVEPKPAENKVSPKDPEPVAELAHPPEETSTETPDKVKRDDIIPPKRESAESTVIVKFEGGTGLPESAWLAWEEGDERQEGEDFDPETRTATIRLEGKATATARVYCDWFGTLVKSDAFEVEPGKTHSITLKAPDGAELRVRVLGPDGRPRPGVTLKVVGTDKHVQAVTDELGEVLIKGIPAPSRQEVAIEKIDEAACCTPFQTATFSTPADRQELLFDLTGTGVVECELKAAGRILPNLDITAEDGQNWPHVAVWNIGQSRPRIYGLKPGRYTVVASGHGAGKFTAEFEVLPPPQISKWNKEFELKTLLVRAHGAPSTEDVRLYHWREGAYQSKPVTAQATGEFLVHELYGEVFLRFAGGGWASEVVSVDLENTTEVDVELVRSGKLELVPRQESATGIIIYHADTPHLRFRIGNSLPRDPDVIELPPGNYTVTSWWFRPGPDRLTATVTAGETTQCHYGAEFICTLLLRSKDRASLWDFTVTVEQDGQEIEVSQAQVWGGGDEYYRLQFQAEGKLKLRIKGETIEDFEREFEIERDKSLSLEIEIKKKQ